MSRLSVLIVVAVLGLTGCSWSAPAAKPAATPAPTPEATRTPNAWEVYKAADKVEEDKAKAVADVEATRIRAEAPAFEVVDTSSGDYLRQNMGGTIRVSVDRTLTDVQASSIMNVLMLDYLIRAGISC